MLATHAAPRSASAPKSPFAAELAALAPDLFGRALRLGRSPAVAEDLVQDTLERAMRFQGQFLPGTNLRAWVSQILFSVFVTRCRRARRERNALAWLSTDPNAWTRPEAVGPMASLSPAVRRALDTLPEGFRAVVILVDLDEQPYKQAAAVLGIPVGTVMSRLFRARRMLAEALGETEQRAAA
jgi:RNA polymerase sigma-70 factor (ECF subfamily)